MQLQNKVIIIGGGIAGLTAALHLQKLNLDVTLIEKNSYPQHKVCGEYVSNEVLPYMAWLGISFEELRPSQITDLQFSDLSGRSITTKLPLGGFGLSRYTMDNFLYQELLKRNVQIIHHTVYDVVYENGSFSVLTTNGQSFHAKHVLGAYGKRSNVDVKLARAFIDKKSPYIAIKAHYRGSFKDNLVGLHNFNGGYCGVSKVEDDLINICYLSDYNSFKQYKKIESFQTEVLYKNRFLKEILNNSTMVFQKPISISQISFERKEPIVNHMLMMGDTAGLIHPLCGNGMAMAVHSAKIAAELIANHSVETADERGQLEKNYEREWKHNFASRISAGKMLSAVLKNNLLQTIALNSLTKMPNLLNHVIKMTHGKPIAMQP
jgi:flavin-dependent dehydrogenase